MCLPLSTTMHTEISCSITLWKWFFFYPHSRRILWNFGYVRSIRFNGTNSIENMSSRLYKITCTCRDIYTTNYIITAKVTYFIRKLSTRNSSVQWRITWTPICIFESERVISARRECDTNFKLMSRRQFLRHSRFLTKRKKKKKTHTSKIAHSWTWTWIYF